MMSLLQVARRKPLVYSIQENILEMAVYGQMSLKIGVNVVLKGSNEASLRQGLCFFVTDFGIPRFLNIFKYDEAIYDGQNSHLTIFYRISPSGIHDRTKSCQVVISSQRCW